MNDAQKWRDRKFRLLLYPDDPIHVSAMETLSAGGYNYVAMLHDKDEWEAAPDTSPNDTEDVNETKKAHWHVVVRFKNAVWSTALAKELGIKPGYIWNCLNLDGAILYLVHYTHPEKYQYPLEEAFGSLKPRLATLLADTDEGTRALSIVELIEKSPGFMGYTELLKKCVAAGLYADLRRMGHFATGLIREHNAEVQAQLDGKDAGQLEAGNFRNWEADVSDSIPFSRRIKVADKNGLLPTA